MVRHGFSEDKEHDKKLVIKSAEKLSNFRQLETRSEYFEFPMCKFLTLRQTMQNVIRLQHFGQRMYFFHSGEEMAGKVSIPLFIIIIFNLTHNTYNGVCSTKEK